jgi:hypothetical protein
MEWEAREGKSDWPTDSWRLVIANRRAGAIPSRWTFVGYLAFTTKNAKGVPLTLLPSYHINHKWNYLLSSGWDKQIGSFDETTN